MAAAAFAPPEKQLPRVERLKESNKLSFLSSSWRREKRGIVGAFPYDDVCEQREGEGPTGLRKNILYLVSRQSLLVQLRSIQAW